jgi:hypothetical protein
MAIENLANLKMIRGFNRHDTKRFMPIRISAVEFPQGLYRKIAISTILEKGKNCISPL